MDIRFVFFDFAGTLDGDGLCWRERFYPIYLKNGFDISYDDFSKAFFDSNDNLPRRHNLKDLGFEKTVFLQVRDVLRYLNINNEKLACKIADEFIEDSKRKIKENTPVLEYLLSKSIKLGIISNFYGNLKRVLESLGIIRYFDVIADSGVLGVSKPSLGIFNYALNALEAKPSLSAMVGDAYERDIVGAHNLGMYHFYITDKDYKSCCEKLYMIRNMRELTRYI